MGHYYSITEKGNVKARLIPEDTVVVLYGSLPVPNVGNPPAGKSVTIDDCVNEPRKIYISRKLAR